MEEENASVRPARKARTLDEEIAHQREKLRKLEERQREQQRVAVGLRHQERWDRGGEQEEQRDAAPADAVGIDAGGQPPHGAVEDGDRGDPRQLDVGEPELLANGNAQHPEHQPDGEHQGEAEGGPDQDRYAALLLRFGSHGPIKAQRTDLTR